MGILDRLLGREHIIEILKREDTPASLLKALYKRRPWNKIKGVLQVLFDQANGDMQPLRAFCFISEEYGLIEKCFCSAVTDSGPMFDSPLQSFSFTLYQLGMELCQEGLHAPTVEQLRVLYMSADMAFISAILCDPIQLSAYSGMAFLCGELRRDRKWGIEYCHKYLAAERALLSTPDGRLTDFHRGIKQAIKSPDETQAALSEMAALDLLPEWVSVSDRPMHDRIKELEQKLLSSHAV